MEQMSEPPITHLEASLPPEKPVSFPSPIVVPLTNAELMAGLEGSGSGFPLHWAVKHGVTILVISHLTQTKGN